MAQDLKRCVIQIRNARGLVCGTGFIINANTAVTCAHVVKAAGEAPGKWMTIAFALTGHTCPAEVLADAWHPADGNDIAILHFQGQLPAGVTPAILGPNGDTAGHPFRAFGYPEVGDMQGIWAEGKILGSITDSQGMMMLQLRSQEIKKGMSGAPVLDTQGDRVVGMVTATYNPDETLKFRDTAFATPIEAIAKIWPSLRLVPSSPSTLQYSPLDTQIGHEVIYRIINTGDHNQFFIGGYERLRDAYIAPWSVFERVKLDRFVGRDWLLEQVDAFLKNHDRGYFILEAAAGLGKTTFLARLIQERGYIHHFVELIPGMDGIASGLKNLAVQLIRAWELNPYSTDEVLPGAATRPDFLQNLLFEAARRRDQIKPDEKIVLVVDALDEAGTSPGQNVLGLPKVLPQGVYLIVSQRPVELTLVTADPRYVFCLLATDRQNLADMQVYLERAIKWEGIKPALQRSDYSARQFVEILLHKCQGVWIYVHFVVGEIERGERSPLNLEILPQGVWQYYAQYWQRWRKQYPEEWDTIHLPMLSTLAAMQEEIPLRRLCTLAGVAEQPALRRLLDETWRPFLVLMEGEERCYRLYHTSLREFLDGQADLTGLTTQEQTLTHELTESTRKAHSHIADYYLAAWGGLETGLTGLQDVAQRDLDEGYGLRHLVAHLEGAGRAADLHHLLRLEWVREEKASASSKQIEKQQRIRQRYENVWYTVREKAGQTDDYLIDIARARGLAEKEFTPQSLTSNSQSLIGLQCRYAVIAASFNSLAENIPSTLLSALVAQGVWTPIQGFAYAQRLSDPERRAEALVKLAPRLRGADCTQALWKAQLAGRAIKDKKHATAILAKLSLRMAKLDDPQAALDVAWTIEDASQRATVLVKLAPRLRQTVCIQILWEALAAAQAIENEWQQRETLARLSLRLAKLSHPQEALAAAQAIENEWQRSKTLSRLSLRLAKLSHPQEAVAAAQAIKDKRQRAEALIELVPYLPASERTRPLQEALTVAREIENKSRLESVLGKLILRLAELGYSQEALTEAWTIKYEERRVEALIELIPYLPKTERTKALQEVVRVGQAIERGRQVGVLARWAPRLVQLGYPQEALIIARVVEDDWQRMNALAELSLRLMELGYHQEALTAARVIENEWRRVKALAKLIPHLLKLLPFADLALARATDWMNQGIGLLVRLLLLVRLKVAKCLYMSLQRVGALIWLVRRLPEPLLRMMLIAQAKEGWWIIDEKRRRSNDMLVELALQLMKLGYSQETWSIVQVLEGKWQPKVVLAKLAFRLVEFGYTQEALVAMGAIYPLIERAQVLAKLAPHLREVEYTDALRDTLAEVRSQNYIMTTSNKAEVVAVLAPYLPEALLQEALVLVRGIQDEQEQFEALAGLTAHLPEVWLREALTIVNTIKDEFYQSKTLVKLIPQLAELGYPQEALARAKEIKVWWCHMEALVKMVPRLAELGYFREALDVIQTIVYEANQPGDFMEAFVEWLAEALTNLAPHLQHTLWKEVLVTVQAIELERVRAHTLAKLTPYVPESLLQEALTIARAIKWPGLQAVALAGIAPRLPAVFQEALRGAQAIEWENEQAETLVKLAPHLPEPLLRKALNMAQTINDKEARVKALVGLAPRLAELGYPAVGLAVTRTIEDEWQRAEAWARLAPHLPEPLLRATLAETQAISEHRRGKALTGLVPRLAELGHLEEAQAIVNEGKWDEVLAELAFQLVKLDQPQEALNTAGKIKDEANRAGALTELAVRLPEAEGTEALAEALAAARSIEEYETVWWKSSGRENLRTAALVRLAPHLARLPLEQLYTLWKETLPVLASQTRPGLLSDLCALVPVIASLDGPEAVAETYRAIQDVGRWWP
ncbi:MAG: hypothetical protein DPW09_15625 [Anaerolineae bacterium]|nr:hypothetical protein [Anaerolineae bacterium]